MTEVRRLIRLRDEPPPRDNRFGSPLKLSRVHWVRPEAVVEVTYLTWTEDNLLRQISYQGQREDKPAKQVVRRVPIQLAARARRADVVRVFKLNGNAIAIRQGCCRQLAPPE